MDRKKINILKRIQEMRDNNISPDFSSLGKEGFEKGLLKSMINEGLINSSSAFSLTDEGEKTLRDYLVIESNKEETQEKYIFDSNVFDDLVSGKLDIDRIVKYKSKNNVEFFITHIQVDEINECIDKDKRAKLFLLMGTLRPIIIPTSSSVAGKSRVGYARLGDGEILEELRQGNIKHTEDALIGETAIKDNLILITNDQTLYKRISDAGGKAFLVDDFLKRIS